MKNVLRAMALLFVIPVASAQLPAGWSDVVKEFDTYVAADKVVGGAILYMRDGKVVVQHNVEEIQKLIDLQTDRAPHLPAFVARDFLRVNREHAWILTSQFTSMLSGRDLMDGRVSRVTMPTLLLWGTRDLLTPYSLGVRMQRELPNAKLVPLNGCGHLAILDCKETAWTAIEKFLK